MGRGGVVKNLRQNIKVDELPILAFESIDEAAKIMPTFFKSEL